MAGYGNYFAIIAYSNFRLDLVGSELSDFSSTKNPARLIRLRFRSTVMYLEQTQSPAQRDLKWSVWHCRNTVACDVSGENR